MGSGRCTFGKGTSDESNTVFGDSAALNLQEFCSSTGGIWSSK
jgi:hypothetical protein